MARTEKVWTLCDWPYSRVFYKGKCWKVSCGHGTIYLIDSPRKSFPFVASFGPNSDRSYSGCFFGHSEITTIEQAKAAIEKKEF